MLGKRGFLIRPVRQALVCRRALLTAITAPFLLAFALTLIFELNWTGKVYNLLTGVSLAGILFLLTRRGYFSLAASCFVCSWIWIVSQVKFQYLGLRLIPQDFAVAFRNPDLIWSFGAWGLGVTLLSAVALAAILWYENTPPTGPSRFFWTAMAIAWLATIGSNFRNVDFTFLKERANALPIFVQGGYRLNLLDPHLGKPSFCCLTADQNAGRFTKAPPELPDIIVILEESLFDPARIPGFRGKAQVPVDFSPLHVWTVGGQSWTQEISVLHGVPPPKYGSIWPVMNLLASVKKLDGRLPNMLRAAGYQTTTVYPVDAETYGARIFHMALGMERFIDCREIPECAAHAGWQNRPDAIFFRYAAQILSASSTPQFIFISTVRQHSPHDKSRPANPDRCDGTLSQTQCSILMDFDDRLRDSIEDYSSFRRFLCERTRRSVVLLFGDHIPADVAYLFRVSSFIDGDRYRTVFHLWDSHLGGITKQSLAPLGLSRPVDVAFIDVLLLSAAGFESGYLREKLNFLRDCRGSFCEKEEEH
jgi:hypothetical protein